MCPITQNQHIRMKPSITDALLDELLKNYSQPGDLLGPDGLLTELKKRLIKGCASVEEVVISLYGRCRGCSHLWVGARRLWISPANRTS